MQDAAWRWPHFEPSEVLDTFGLEQYSNGNLLLQPHALTQLERFRFHVGKPLIVLSGYRSPTHNAEVGGVEGSRHVQGLAFDLSCKDIDSYELYISALKFGWHFVLHYPDKMFVHVDMRPVCTSGSWAG